MFRDRNFVASFIMIVCVSMVMLATSALLAPYLQNLAGYPVYTAGLSLSPRSIGTVISMFLAARLSKWIDQRKIMAVGLVVLGWALHAMSAWTPDVTEEQMILTLIVQGFSIGLVFNPLAVIAFSTLQSQFRGDATALQALARNIGSAIGISVTSFTLERSAQAMHADIAAGITPFNRLLQHTGAAQIYDLATQHGAALLNQEITRQSQIIAYNNDFHMMAYVVVPPLLLILLMRRTGVSGPKL
jgi:DHA2 family multidrug resistance protein